MSCRLLGTRGREDKRRAAEYSVLRKEERRRVREGEMISGSSSQGDKSVPGSSRPVSPRSDRRKGRRFAIEGDYHQLNSQTRYSVPMPTKRRAFFFICLYYMCIYICIYTYTYVDCDFRVLYLLVGSFICGTAICCCGSTISGCYRTQ